MAHESFQVGDLTAVVGDNEVYDDRRAGYSGIHRLVHRTLPERSLFGVAGLNFEHIFDGEQDQLSLLGDGKVFFEPRNHPMSFRRLSDVEAELHQEPTPTYHLESWSRFKFSAPHYIDFTFRCRPTQHVFRNGYIGLFWASYINAPENKSIYFRDPKGWVQLCTQEHNNQSTVRHVDDRLELKFRNDAPRETLYKNFSPLRYVEPFYYGYYGTNHVFILMFDRVAGIRFSHSPSSGGPPSFPNPAWDFQYIIPSYDVLMEYSFRARAIYRERCPRDEIEREYREWRQSIGT
jgi:hypothetical protein